MFLVYIDLTVANQGRGRSPQFLIVIVVTRRRDDLPADAH